MLFKGLGTALITPFEEDGSVDFASLEKLVDNQLKGGVDALIVCGTTGEPPTLSDTEKSQVIRFVVKQVNGRIPVIAGTGSNCTATAAENSRRAEDMGADGDYTSFPSGHTSSAAHIFLFAALCDIIPGWDRKGVRIGVNIGCTAFTAVVAISRIVANAHFLSDVLVGGYLTYLIFVALRRAFFGRGKYNFAVALPREEKAE